MLNPNVIKIYVDDICKVIQYEQTIDMSYYTERWEHINAAYLTLDDRDSAFNFNTYIYEELLTVLIDTITLDENKLTYNSSLLNKISNTFEISIKKMAKKFLLKKQKGDKKDINEKNQVEKLTRLFLGESVFNTSTIGNENLDTFLYNVAMDIKTFLIELRYKKRLEVCSTRDLKDCVYKEFILEEVDSLYNILFNNKCSNYYIEKICYYEKELYKYRNKPENQPILIDLYGSIIYMLMRSILYILKYKYNIDTEELTSKIEFEDKINPVFNVIVHVIYENKNKDSLVLFEIIMRNAIEFIKQFMIKMDASSNPSEGYDICI